MPPGVQCVTMKFMEIFIIQDTITKDALADIAKEQFGDFVKAVVDLKQEIMAIGGELHADAEARLLAHGSQQENVWGVNLYPSQSEGEWIVYDSMINVRPSQGNRSRGIEDPNIRAEIKKVIQKLVH